MDAGRKVTGRSIAGAVSVKVAWSNAGTPEVREPCRFGHHAIARLHGTVERAGHSLALQSNVLRPDWFRAGRKKCHALALSNSNDPPMKSSAPRGRDSRYWRGLLSTRVLSPIPAIQIAGPPVHRHGSSPLPGGRASARRPTWLRTRPCRSHDFGTAGTHRRSGTYVRSKTRSRQFRAAFFMSGSPASQIPAPHWWYPNLKEPTMTPQRKFDFDVTAQPAMPPPPRPRPETSMESASKSMGLAKSNDPRHNPGRGDHL